MFNSQIIMLQFERVNQTVTFDYFCVVVMACLTFYNISPFRS